MPDLPLEHRLILYRDVPTTDRDGALRLEVRERSVHGDTRRTDERGEVVLCQLDLRLRMCRGEVEQAFRDATWHVEEDEVLDATGGATDGASKQTQDLAHRARVALDHMEKVVTRKGHDVGLAEGGDGGRPRSVIEERELAEHRAFSLDGEDDLMALLVGHRD